MRSSITRFNHHFFHALWKIQGIIYGLIAWLMVNAAAIAYFEKMPFADALYFSFVTGLTIGYTLNVGPCDNRIEGRPWPSRYLSSLSLMPEALF